MSFTVGAVTPPVEAEDNAGNEMAKNINQTARRLGATVFHEVPETAGGAFGAARLARIVEALQSRLVPGQGRPPIGRELGRGTPRCR